MELAGSIAKYYPARQPRQRPEELGELLTNGSCRCYRASPRRNHR